MTSAKSPFFCMIHFDPFTPVCPLTPGLSDQFDQITLGFPLLWTDRLHVNIGRHFQTRMTQQLLNYLWIFPIGVQECSKRVPESVKADFLGDAGTLERWQPVVPPQSSRPIRLLAFHERRREHPIASRNVLRLGFPRKQRLCRLRIQRNVFHRSFGLWCPFYHCHDRSSIHEG